MKFNDMNQIVKHVYFCIKNYIFNKDFKPNLTKFPGFVLPFTKCGLAASEIPETSLITSFILATFVCSKQILSL